jgi:hypothetical protein
MRYLLLLNRDADEDLPDFGTPEAAAMFTAWKTANEAMAAAGVLVDCAPLESTTAATIVRVRGGQTVLTDGPAAELKEQIGGYAIVECADLDEAVRWASTLPAARDASVEVRPVADTGMPG